MSLTSVSRGGQIKKNCTGFADCSGCGAWRSISRRGVVLDVAESFFAFVLTHGHRADLVAMCDTTWLRVMNGILLFFKTYCLTII